MPVLPSGLSLHRRLISSILLAVVSGYAVLFVMHELISRLQRLQAHDLLVIKILESLSRDPDATLAAMAATGGVNGPLGWTGVTLQPLPAATHPTPARFRSQGERRLIESVLAFSSPTDAEGRVRVRQDVTDAIASQRQVQFLLIAATGLSTLFTSALLRPILQRRMDEPINQLSRSLRQAPLPPLPLEPLLVERQPLELQPIAAAFNALLQRLVFTLQQQRSFIDGVAHELRTPITLISGYAQRMQRSLSLLARLDPQLAEAVAAIVTESQRLTRLISDLLELSRLDTDRIELQCSPIDLDDLLLLTYERLEPLASGRLQIRGPADGERRQALADPERLQQCFGNLVENALKYAASAGPIELFVSSEADRHLLHVRDHGPGVPAGEREAIFQRFVRGVAASQQSGSGIGLAVVRLLLERMGGSARVVAAPGGGADFQLILPALNRSSASAARPGWRPPPALGRTFS
jgi:signal transduction histidine kinase